jgi:hypothetical protein
LRLPSPKKGIERLEMGRRSRPANVVELYLNCLSNRYNTNMKYCYVRKKATVSIEFLPQCCRTISMGPKEPLMTQNTENRLQSIGERKPVVPQGWGALSPYSMNFIVKVCETDAKKET